MHACVCTALYNSSEMLCLLTQLLSLCRCEELFSSVMSVTVCCCVKPQSVFFKQCLSLNHTSLHISTCHCWWKFAWTNIRATAGNHYSLVCIFSRWNTTWQSVVTELIVCADLIRQCSCLQSVCHDAEFMWVCLCVYACGCVGGCLGVCGRVLC